MLTWWSDRTTIGFSPLRTNEMIVSSRWLAALLAVLPLSSPAVTDPSQEPLAVELEKSVKVLTDWWVGKGTEEAVLGILAERVESEPIWPTELTRSELPGGLEARFWVRPLKVPSSSGPAKVLKLLAFSGLKASRTEAKIVRLEEDKSTGTIQSELILGVYRFEGGRRQEMRLRCRSVWVRQGDRILLKRNELRKYSELILKTKDPFLRDRTTAILPKGSADDPELTQGNFYWRHRIEAMLQPDPFGHNGISVADFNGDGRQDLFLVQMGGLRNRAYFQQVDGTCLDWSAQSGLDFLDNTTSALFVDLDNDGDQDAVLATSSGLLLCANNGTGHFTLQRRLADLRYVFGLSAADYDRDGDLDLYACQYYGDRKGEDEQRGSIPVPFPIYDANNGGRNVLLRNDGNFVFADVTVEVGLEKNNRRFSYVSLWEDWDRDGDPDLVVVNDFGRLTGYENQEGTFVEDSTAKGFAMSSFGMGVAAADFNRDGWMDLHVSNMFSGAGNRISREPEFRGHKGERRVEEFRSMAAGNTLYLNRAGKTFQEVGQQAGVEMGRWSWGCVAPDLNNDGWEDLLVANGFMTGRDLDDL